MILKREFWQQSKEENERTKVRKLFEAVPELEEPCRNLKGLIKTVSGLYNCAGLNPKGTGGGGVFHHPREVFG